MRSDGRGSLYGSDLTADPAPSCVYALGVAIFQTARLLARPWTLDDVNAAFEIYGDPRVMKTLGTGPAPDIGAMRERLSAVLERNAPFAGRMGFWALEASDSGTIVGSVILKPLPESERVEVGWHLGHAHWGQGYATEAGRGAVAYGFESLGLDTIWAIVLPTNERSLAVARRLGMRSEGLTDAYHNLTLELFSIRPGELRP
ncbi:MAG: GNAT family N-acetyltransferase [Fimbriimonadaceae bacterium]|nr:GNAT family N-acetyltransferase [Fimbriimonadaceae bacterium]